MCTRCGGFIVREKLFERITGCIPCHYCVNCGYYIDAVIRRNKAMSPKELANLRLNETETQPDLVWVN